MAILDLPLREDQQMLVDSVRRYIADHARPGWRELADVLGLAGLSLPEAAGGFGGGACDMALVMAELGPAFAGADWLSHAAAAFVLCRVAPDLPLLPDLAAGNRRAAIVCPASAAEM